MQNSWFFVNDIELNAILTFTFQNLLFFHICAIVSAFPSDLDIQIETWVVTLTSRCCQKLKFCWSRSDDNICLCMGMACSLWAAKNKYTYAFPIHHCNQCFVSIGLKSLYLIPNLFQTLKSYSSHTANLKHTINSNCSHCKLKEMLEASSLFIHTIYTNQNYNFGQVKSCFQ